jgi:hypothetical protein
MWVITNFRWSFEILARSFRKFSAGKYVKVATVYLEVHLEHKWKQHVYSSKIVWSLFAMINKARRFPKKSESSLLTSKKKRKQAIVI